MPEPKDLIDKGTHMEDADGNKYARTEHYSKPRGKSTKRRRRPIRPADSDIIFGLWIEKKRGNIRLCDIADATGWSPQGLITHAKKMGFDEKVEKIVGATKTTKGSLSIEKVQASLSEKLILGAEEHQMSIDDLMAKTRQHYKKMKGPAILKQAKEIDTLDKVGRRLYGLDKEEQRAASAPVLNVAFLMSAGMPQPQVAVTPAED